MTLPEAPICGDHEKKSFNCRRLFPGLLLSEKEIKFQ
jgi:hypothetical protein